MKSDNVLIFLISVLLFLSFSLSVFSQVVFDDVTYNAHVTANEDKIGQGHGVVFADFNNDGWEDLYLLVTLDFNHLFLNNQNGTFEDIAWSAGVAGPDTNVGDRGTNAVDYDNDGDLDLYLSNTGINWLLRNDGDLHFSNVTWSSGAGGSSWTLGGTSVWADYNGDGYIEPFASNWDGMCQLFRNNGNGSFSEITLQAGLYNEQGYSPSSTWLDYDNDGDPDLFVSRARGNPNRLWRNNGDGSFTDVGEQAGLAIDIEGHGASIVDYDNDGFIDILQVSDKGANALFHNNGDGTFTNVASQAGVDDNQRTLAGAWGDFDNDGWMDLYTVNFWRPNVLYFNNGDGTFRIDDNFYRDWEAGYSITLGDYNNDGFLDIYHSNSGQKVHLYQNQGNSNHWLKIRLHGVVSNSYGVGARVSVYTNDLVRHQELSTGSGYAGQNSLILNFGLGQHTSADKIVVRWPSGYNQTLIDVAADQFVTIVEENNSKFDITGKIVYYSNELPVENVCLNVNNGEHLFRNEGGGGYSFTLDSWSNYVVGPERDPSPVDDDWAIDMYDAALIAQYVAGLRSLTSEQQVAARIDSTQNISFFNAAQIARHVVELNTVGDTWIGEWRFSPPERSYSMIGSDQNDQDYAAILLGDVSGNWTPLSSMQKNTVKTDWLSKSCRWKKDTLIVSVQNVPDHQMISYDFSLEYPAKTMTYNGTEFIPGNKEMSFYVNTTDGKIRIGVISVVPCNDDRELFRLKFYRSSSDFPAPAVLQSQITINNDYIETSVMNLNQTNHFVDQPTKFMVLQNYPNPFNNTTSIPLHIPGSGRVRARVYNGEGHLVKNLVDRKFLAGYHTLYWNGKNDQNVPVASGVYFVRVQFQQFINTVKIIALQ